MNYKKLIGNAAIAFAAQGAAMLVGVFMSFVVPKLLDIDNYGYWQLFIFYATYAGIFCLGLNDGVYLINGGVTRDSIDRSAISAQYRVLTVMQSFMCIAVQVAAVIFISDSNRVFVICLVGLYFIVNNLCSYLGYTFQAMNETKLFSYATVLDRLTLFVLLITLLLLKVDDYCYYIISYLISKTVSLLWSVWKARDILACRTMALSQGIKESVNSIRVGFSLMIANLADMLLLGVGRFMVDLLWGISDFGKVSFAMSIINFAINFVSQASMVLFPALRQEGEASLTKLYQFLRDSLDLLLPILYLVYFPARWILSIWLPNYVDSIFYLAVLMPVCVYNAKMNIVSATYCKVLRKERQLLGINLAAVLLCAVLSVSGILLAGSLDAVLLAAVFCVALRSAVSERWMDNLQGVSHSNIGVANALITTVFLMEVYFTSNSVVQIAAVALLYIAVLIINRNTAASFIFQIKRLIR